MAKNKRPCFLLERDQKEIVDELTDEEAGQIFKAIYEYETSGKEIKLNKTLKLVFKHFKIKLDFYDKQYEDKCLTNKENAEKRWEKYKNAIAYDGIRTNAMDTNKRKEKKIKENKNKEKQNKIDNINNINNSVCVNNIVAVATPTPTLNEIISFGKSLGVDEKYCKKFFNNYESVDWKVGNKKIKNWKAKLEQWIQEDNIKNNLPSWYGKEIRQEVPELSEEGKRLLEQLENEDYEPPTN